MPGLIWNMMMSMSGGWFFVVASEAITVGNTTITLPGVGSYMALAIEQQEPAGDRLGDPGDAVVILPTTSCCSARWSPGPTSSASSRPAPNAPESWLLDLVRRTR
jgi:NitT/TauT family transport system permease protein